MARRKKQDSLRQSVLSDKRDAAMALAIRGFDWRSIVNQTGVNKTRAQNLDARLDRGSMLPGSMFQAQQVTPSAFWMHMKGGTGNPAAVHSANLQRAQQGITNDFLRQYGSKDFLSQLKIRREKLVETQQPIGQEPEPTPKRQPKNQPVSGPDTSSLPPLYYQPTPGVYQPFDVEDESLITGGSPQDATRRGGVRRNKSNRAGAVSKTRNSLSIGGGATAPGTAIGGRQLSL